MCLLIINDRVDVALAIDADGVHVGQSDMPCDVTRKLVGPRIKLLVFQQPQLMKLKKLKKMVQIILEQEQYFLHQQRMMHLKSQKKN